MTKHTFTLEGDFAVSKGSRAEGWNETATVDLAALATPIVQALVLHGLRQKIADAASGAKTPAEASASMAKAVDALLAGEWSSRQAGGGVDEATKVARQVTREVFKAKVGAASPAWKDFTGLADGEQADKLDAMFAKNEAALRPAVDAKLEELRKARERKAGLAADFTI